MPKGRIAKLARLSRAELQSLAAQANQALSDLQQREERFLASIEKQAKTLGMELSDLVERLIGSPKPSAPVTVRKGRRTSPNKGKTVKPWFRDPVSKATWSGRGRVARWLADYLAAGRRITEFLIDKSKLEDAKRIEAKALGKAAVAAKPARAKGAAKKRSAKGATGN